MSLALSDPLHLWSIISYMWCSMLHRVLDVVHCDGLGVCFCIIWPFHALALRNSDNFRPSLPMISNNWTLSNRFTVRKMNLSRPVHRISKIEECTCCNSRDVRFESSSICKAFWWVLFDGCSSMASSSIGVVVRWRHRRASKPLIQRTLESPQIWSLTIFCVEQVPRNSDSKVFEFQTVVPLENLLLPEQRALYAVFNSLIPSPHCFGELYRWCAQRTT